MYKQSTCNYGSAVLLSIILGVGTAVLFSLGFLTGIANALWIAFGVSAGVLGLFLILTSVLSVSPFACFKKALRLFGGNVVIGSVGTLVTSLAALSVTLVVASTISAIVVFLVAAFFFFMLTSLVQMLFLLICQESCCH